MSPEKHSTEPTPNELDQTDESRNAADITAAGEGLARRKDADPDCPGESPTGSSPFAPDGRRADRYAG